MNWEVINSLDDLINIEFHSVEIVVVSHGFQSVAPGICR
jgi:hypothetical protein